MGQQVEAGDELTEGSVDPKEMLRVKGLQGVQNYLLREVQRVYRLQGVDINDKHVEVMIRQMLRKVRILDAGDTDLLPGTYVDLFDYEAANRDALLGWRRTGRCASGAARYYEGVARD